MISKWGKELKQKNIEVGVHPKDEQWLYCTFINAKVCFFYSRKTCRVEQISVGGNFYHRVKDRNWNKLFERADQLPSYLRDITEKIDANTIGPSKNHKDLVDLILAVYSTKV